ncbi:MAG: hypothetical protein H8D74_01035 [Chloroflexi bacterium]|nr:hypothetical protein [Chloroflexota bacterium]
MPIYEGTVDFINYVEGAAEIVVPGVVRNYGMEPPLSVSTPDLPAQYLQLPVTNRERFALAIDGEDMHGSGMMTVEVVVVLEPIVQDLPQPNFTRTVEMVDALTKAYTQADIALSWPIVSVRVTAETLIAGTVYWAAVATVTARG